MPAFDFNNEDIILSEPTNLKYITYSDAYERFPLKDKYTKEEFKEALSTFSMMLGRVIATTGSHVELGDSRAGFMSVRKKYRPGGTTKVDWVHFNKTGEWRTKKFYNEHTDNFVAKMFWLYSKPYTEFYHHAPFEFKSNRVLAAGISRLINSDNYMRLYQENPLS